MDLVATRALAFSAPVLSVGGGMVQSIQWGISRAQQVVWLEKMTRKLGTGIQSLIAATDVVPSALDSVVKEMRLGNQVVEPLRPDELGARIYTDHQTGIPTGYFQICYVRFRQAEMNPLFEVDPTALPFLLKWMSENTQIKGRIAGRTLYIDDPGILESPMLYMNGMRAVRFREAEKRNLTRYLVERGGFIFVDDDHSWGPLSNRAFAHSMRAQFREIILGAGGRELSRIPNDHSLWNQPFRLGGQPKDPNGFGPTYPMTAFELDGHIAVVISYNDYNNGWEAPGTGLGGIDYVPSILRMGVNFMFYAATHGKISDYKHYVPPERGLEKGIPFPKRVPQAATISATGTERKI